MIELAVDVLYTITVSLKAPIVLGVLAALAWSLFEAGRCCWEWLERRRLSPRWRGAQETFSSRPARDGQAFWELLAGDCAPDLVSRLVPGGEPSSLAERGELPRLLPRTELEAARRLARLRIGLRLGPVAGLIGTLIPMGPALMGVSRGDLAAMSSELLIAFGTTVVGLLVGALFFVMLVVRQHWYASDLADVEHLLGLVGSEDTP